MAALTLTAYTPGALSEAATNLCTNGGFETNTVGWANGVGGVVTRDTSEHKFGVASGKFVTPGSVVNEFIEFDLSGLTPGLTYGASAWIKSVAGVVLYIKLADAATNPPVVPFACDGTWQPVFTSLTSGATTAQFFLATYNTGVPQAVTAYIDGVHIDASGQPRPYVELTPIT